MSKINRRSFLGTSAAGVIAGAAFNSGILHAGSVSSKPASPEEFHGHLKKSVYYSMLPKALSILEKFELSKRVGFEGIEVPTIEESDIISEINEAAQKTGIKVHSIMNQAHWRYPLSSSDPSVIQKSIEGMETSLHNAKEYKADTVLLVPAVVNAETSYKDAWVRSQKHIRKLLYLAEELNVIIAIENVWNKFLVSPLEFARYIDEFDSPYLKAYFDVGNIAMYGVPHDWIRTLGSRIVKVHIKGFHYKNREFVNLGDGTIDWLEVRRAFSEIRYSGFINAELRGGDEEYLLDVSKRMDKIIAGQKIF